MAKRGQLSDLVDQLEEDLYELGEADHVTAADDAGDILEKVSRYLNVVLAILVTVSKILALVGIEAVRER